MSRSLVRFAQPLTRRIKRRCSVLSPQRLQLAFRKLLPTLLVLIIASAAHAQGTMDFSGATTLMATFRTFAMYAGAVICLGGLIFAGIRMMSGRFSEAVPGLFGALFGAGVLGWGAGRIGPATQGRSPDGRIPGLPCVAQLGGACLYRRADCGQDGQVSRLCDHAAQTH